MLPSQGGEAAAEGNGGRGGGREARRKEEGRKEERRLTEQAVVLPGALNAAVGQDLKVKTGPAVELPPAQDALQVG